MKPCGKERTINLVRRCCGSEGRRYILEGRQQSGNESMKWAVDTVVSRYGGRWWKAGKTRGMLLMCVKPEQTGKNGDRNWGGSNLGEVTSCKCVIWVAGVQTKMNKYQL